MILWAPQCPTTQGHGPQSVPMPMPTTSTAGAGRCSARTPTARQRTRGGGGARGRPPQRLRFHPGGDLQRSRGIQTHQRPSTDIRATEHGQLQQEEEGDA